MIFKNQEKVWDKIANLWNDYKKLQTAGAIKFLKKQKGKVLDLGCGSGRNFVKTDAEVYAVDFSQKMVDLAKENAKKQNFNIEVSKADATNLPFKDNFFDSAISVAVLHCIESKLKRKKALKELRRVLKPNGKALITVWDKEARRFKNKPKDLEVSWNVEGKKIFRYYYLYDKEEFESLLESAGFKITKRLETQSNLIVIVEKV